MLQPLDRQKRSQPSCAYLLAAATILSFTARALAQPAGDSSLTEVSPGAADFYQEISSVEVELAVLNAQLRRLRDADEAKGDDEDAQARAEAIDKMRAKIAGLSQARERLVARLSSIVANSGDASPQSEPSVGDLNERRREAMKREETMEAMQAYRRRVQELEEAARKSQESQSLPPLNDPQTMVFELKYLKAQSTADALVDLFGLQRIRVAAGDDGTQLIVATEEPLVENVAQLIQSLDKPQGEPRQTVDAPTQANQEAGAPRSLTLRTFWLADSLPEGEGQDPAKFLPKSVLAAVQQLGLDEPRLVAQTVNSLSRDANPEHDVPFSTRIPALIFNQPAQLSGSGKVLPVRDGRAELEVLIQVAGPTVNAELGGSLATPLGHYMVLGTANSVSGLPATMPAGMMGGMGMEGGRGGYGARGGYGGEFGGRGGGFDGEMGGAAVDPATGMPIGPDGNPLPEPKFNTSHFAFVVQVVEAESFAEEQ